jgi:hypothetical protein
VVIPEVVFRHVSAPAKPERKGQIQFVCTENDTPQKQDKPVQSITEEMNQNQETQKESLDTHNEDCMQDNFELEELDESDDKIARFDWKYLYNKHLLGILKVKKERKTNFSNFTNCKSPVSKDYYIFLGKMIYLNNCCGWFFS